VVFPLEKRNHTILLGLAQRLTVDGIEEQCGCWVGVGGLQSSRSSMHWSDNMLLSKETQPPCMVQIRHAHHEKHGTCILLQFTCRVPVKKAS
jgi:hypothetical protein